MMLAVGMSASLCSSCMDGDWDEPKFDETNIPYGDNSIEATNVITIAQLKAMYPKYAENYAYTEMTEEAQLKVYVTGNDIQGNLYNSIAVQDDNGDAMLICISESGLYGYLPVGQWILIDTKGLYIGGYGSQPQIGTPYTNSSGSTYVSRMASNVWQSHFKILHGQTKPIQTVEEYEDEPKEGAYVIPEYTVANMAKLDMSANCGKLMTVTGAEIDGADGTSKVWASETDAGSQTSVSLYFKGQGQTMMTYTSTYCDFANAIVPTGKLSLTGIWKQYNGKWELILRSEKDIVVE